MYPIFKNMWIRQCIAFWPANPTWALSQYQPRDEPRISASAVRGAKHSGNWNKYFQDCTVRTFRKNLPTPKVPERNKFCTSQEGPTREAVGIAIGNRFQDHQNIKISVWSLAMFGAQEVDQIGSLDGPNAPNKWLVDPDWKNFGCNWIDGRH